MGESYTEVQKRSSTNRQSIDEIEVNISVDEMWEDAYPEDFYDGPSAFTAKELSNARPSLHHDSARTYAERMVRKGKWVRVSVDSGGVPGHPFVQAWVRKDIYDDWVANR